MTITALRPSRPVERIPNGARVTVDLAPQLGLVLPGKIVGCVFGENPRYDIDISEIGSDLKGAKLINMPAGRIHREEEGT